MLLPTFSSRPSLPFSHPHHKTNKQRHRSEGVKEKERAGASIMVLLTSFVWPFELYTCRGIASVVKCVVCLLASLVSASSKAETVQSSISINIL